MKLKRERQEYSTNVVLSVKKTGAHSRHSVRDSMKERQLSEKDKDTMKENRGKERKRELGIQGNTRETEREREWERNEEK